jgi:hypothetical protein
MADSNSGIVASPETKATAAALVERVREAVPRPDGLSDMEYGQLVLCAAFQAVVGAANNAMEKITLGCALHAHGLAAGILMAEATPEMSPDIKSMVLQDMDTGRDHALQQWKQAVEKHALRGKLDS